MTSLQRATLIPGGSEALLYATVSGSLGVLLPFTSREDHDFFQHLEMHMRSENAPLCGRDHLSYRSYYYPVKVSITSYKLAIPTVSQQVFSTRILMCYTVGRAQSLSDGVCACRYGCASLLPVSGFLRVESTIVSALVVFGTAISFQQNFLLQRSCI